MTTIVAVIQKPPILLDRQETIERVLDSIDEAVGEDASLLVFPEAYIPGYPTWIWRLRPGGDMALSAEIHARLRENAVDLDRGDLQPVQDAAAEHGVTIVLGINELDGQFSGTTIFNTVVVIGSEGTILNRHRKVMPTNPERMVWGMGDASGLRVVSYMPLARYALYAQDIEIYVAPTWDASDSWLATMRHIAKEAGCWVIGTATAMQGSDLPNDFPERDSLFDSEEWINDGNAVVVKPMGTVVAGPLTREKGILYAEIDKEDARQARRSLDICGHYSRPDIFSFSVNRRPLDPVTFED
jgi:nitrilase